MTASNFFCVNRKLFKNPLWHEEPFTKAQAWIDLIGRANHSTKNIYIRSQKVIVKRGQTARSILTLSKEWQWSVNKVKRFLDRLENEQMITQKRTNITTLITVCNYNDYQAKKESDELPDELPDELQTKTNKEGIKTINKDQKRRANPVPTSPPRPETIQHLNRFGFKKSFVNFVIRKYSDEEIKTAILVLEQAKNPKNPKAFFNQALIEKWKPKTVSKSKNKVVAMSEYQKEHSDDTEAFINNLSPELREEFLKEREEFLRKAEN